MHSALLDPGKVAPDLRPQFDGSTLLNLVTPAIASDSGAVI
jgi:hypothetical protein